MKTLFLTLLAIVLPCLSWAGSDTTAIYGSEKIYLHTDRAQFMVGDTVWFRAYAVEAKQHRPEVKSRVLYVALTGPSRQPVSQQRIDIRQGTGFIALSDSLMAGRYELTAYTNWMRNEDEAFFFRKTITLLPRQTTQRTLRTTSVESVASHERVAKQTAPNVQFFPEGGHLVVGLTSRVAFKAVGLDGYGATISGHVEDQNGQQITRFTTEYRGMGVFTLTPQPGATYRAVLDGDSQALPLPIALPDGVTLAVFQAVASGDVRIRVARTQTSSQTVHLLAHMRGQPVFEQTLQTKHALINTNIPARKLPQEEGILHLTLFDDQQKPLAERLVYINRGQRLSLGLRAGATDLKAGQPLSLTLNAIRPNGQPGVGQFSVAVTDATQTLPDLNSSLLPTYLGLTSDLKGFVEAPQEYFSSEPKAGIYLDYLMMTQGWRRFEWSSLLSNAPRQVNYPIEDQLSWRGQAMKGKEPLANESLMAFVRSVAQSAPLSLQTDEAGRFQLTAPFDTDSLVSLFRLRANRPLRVTIDQDYQPTGAGPDVMTETLEQQGTDTVANDVLDKAARLAIERDRQQRKLRGERVIDLNEVMVKTKRADPLKDDFRRMMYGGEPSYSVKVESHMIVGNQPLAILVGKIPNFRLYDRQEELMGNENRMFCLIDGIEATYSLVDALNPHHIDRIDVLRPPISSIFGVKGANGAINILLKKGPDIPAAPVVNQQVVILRGFAATRSFYVPAFLPANGQVTPVDLRATRYWNPQVQTDASGRAIISFPTDGQPVNLRVVVQGISPNGEAGAVETLIHLHKQGPN